MEGYRDRAVTMNEEFDEAQELEMRERRKKRRELAKHKRAITRCNLLLLCEGAVMVILIIALILVH